MRRDGEDQTIAFTVLPGAVKPAIQASPPSRNIRARRYEEGYRMVGYSGVAPLSVLPAGRLSRRGRGREDRARPAASDICPAPATMFRRRWRICGQNVRILAASDITQGDLSGYDAIILGARAYAVRPELKSANSRLLEYVKNGGVLIVQYNLQDFDQNYGPYPFSLGNNPQKVVDETSKVTLAATGRVPVFTWPNRITEADFAGWVEERGHGFMQTWDSHYEPLVETTIPIRIRSAAACCWRATAKARIFTMPSRCTASCPPAFPGVPDTGESGELGKNPAWAAAK